MNTKTIFQEFIKTISALRIHQQVVKQIAQKEYKDYQKVLEDFAIVDKKGENFVDGLYGLHFHNLLKEKRCERIAFERITPNDYQKNILIRENKQYQWLLAEGYEAYAKFLKKIYVCFGDHNPTSSANNIKPNKILIFFRQQFPKFKTLEKSNFLEVDYEFNIILIQELRHEIVHNHGEIQNFEEFKKDIYEKAGVINNGNPPPRYENLIESLIKKPDDKYFVLLHQDVYMTLIGCLISHAHLVNHYVGTSLKENEI